MGGDYGPPVVVPGAVAAQRQLHGRCRIVLVGDQDQLVAEVEAAGGQPDHFDFVHAPDNILMNEAPASAIRRKPHSSIVVASQLLKQGEADAFVSAGSTGAVAAAALLIVGRLPGVDRPGIATLLPNRRGVGLVIDVGANSDCKPQQLLQFAAMGRIYVERILGQDAPTVGLLNIGEEPSKGNELSQEAYKLLAANEPSFIGNIEGREVFDGKASVIVTDGFVGNVVLKILESVAGFLFDEFRREIRNDLRALAGAWMLKPALKDFARRFHYAEYGGAPLLGCNGVIIICHGGSSPEAITNAIRVAEKGVRDRIPHRIHEEIEREEARRRARTPEPAAQPIVPDSSEDTP
jgi:glycerol-3-phosphate acyltransferase PlsX